MPAARHAPAATAVNLSTRHPRASTRHPREGGGGLTFKRARE